MAIIDPIARAFELRKTLVNEQGELLVVDYSNTLQGVDTSQLVDTQPNIRTGEGVIRCKCNAKDIDPLAALSKGKKLVDIREMEPEAIVDVIKRQEFDFPLWFMHDEGYDIHRANDFNLPLIIQAAGCNFHDGSATGGCKYCFVDDISNDGVVGCGKTYVSVRDMIDSITIAQNNIARIYDEVAGYSMRPQVFRTSGGEPTIVLDWILEAWRDIERCGLGLVGQLDSNLSTGTVVDEFEKEGVYEPHILEKLAEYPIKVLTAIKGVSNANLMKNVQATATLETQLHSIKKFLEAGFDIYPQMYNPEPKRLAGWLNTMEDEIENFSARVHISHLFAYGPTKARLTAEALAVGKDPEKHIAHMEKQWATNYERGTEILDAFLWGRHRVGYKEVPRPDVDLKLR